MQKKKMLILMCVFPVRPRDLIIAENIFGHCVTHVNFHPGTPPQFYANIPLN